VGALICTPSGSRTGAVFCTEKLELPKRVSLNALEVARANPPAPAGKKRQSLVAVADVIEQLHAGPFSAHLSK